MILSDADGPPADIRADMVVHETPGNEDGADIEKGARTQGEIVDT